MAVYLYSCLTLILCRRRIGRGVSDQRFALTRAGTTVRNKIRADQDAERLASSRAKENIHKVCEVGIDRLCYLLASRNGADTPVDAFGSTLQTYCVTVQLMAHCKCYESILDVSENLRVRLDSADSSVAHAIFVGPRPNP